MVYVFEGREIVRKGRNALINPVYFGGSYAGAEGNSQFWDRVQEYILKNYDQRSLKCIYISGDGASWINAGTEHIAKSVFVTDRFHLMKYINAAAWQMLDDCDEVKGEIYKNIWKGRLKKIQKLFKRMRKSASSLKQIDECEISGQQLGRHVAGIPRSRSHRLQRAGTCEPSLQRPDEFPTDGVERDRCGPDVPPEVFCPYQRKGQSHRPCKNPEDGSHEIPGRNRDRRRGDQSQRGSETLYQSAAGDSRIRGSTARRTQQHADP